MNGSIFCASAIGTLLLLRFRSRNRISRNMGLEKHNWAGNVEFQAGVVLHPENEQQVIAIVVDHPQVKAFGTRHCFNDIADTVAGGTHISTARMRDIDFDEHTNHVCVGPGVTYTELIAYLRHRGRAFFNVPSLPHITVVGSVLTGTHGTGYSSQILAAAVVAMTLVSHSGELVRITRESERFKNYLVNLGAIGIITKLELETCETFQIEKCIYKGLTWTTLFENFDNIWTSAEHISMFCEWETREMSTVWLGHVTSIAKHKQDEFFGAKHITEHSHHPIPSLDAKNCVTTGLGSWGEKLYHFLPHMTPSSGSGTELQSEYFVKYEVACQALDALWAISRHFRHLILVTEVRMVLGDEILMSPVFSPTGDSQRFIAIHFTWRPQGDGVSRAIRQVEGALEPFGAKPHLGKLFSYSTRALGKVYGENLAVFRQLVLDLDPHGKFSNRFTREQLAI